MKTKQILETVFNNQTLVTFVHDNQEVWFAAQIAKALGYSRTNKISSLISGEWCDEFVEREHYYSVNTKDVEHLRRVDPYHGSTKSRHYLLLTEEGVNLVLIKTKKRVGVELRRHLTHVVLPQFRRDMISEKSYEELKAKKDAEISELKDEILGASRKLIRATEKIVERGDKLLERDEMILERDNMLFEKHQEIVDLHVERADSVPSLRRIAKCAGQALQAQKGTKKLRN